MYTYLAMQGSPLLSNMHSTADASTSRLRIVVMGPNGGFVLLSDPLSRLTSADRISCDDATCTADLRRAPLRMAYCCVNVMLP